MTSSRSAALLIAPAMIFVFVLFGIPLVGILRMSLNEWQAPKFYVDGLTVAHYRRIAEDPLFLRAVWNSLRLAVIASAIAVTLAYAVAFITWYRPGRWRLAIIGLMLCPMLISEIAIIFGWWMFLPKNGLLSWTLVQTGLRATPVSLLYTEFAAFLGLVYLILPFSFFILLSMFQKLDRQNLEASADLGAPAWRSFVEILLPQTWRGILLALSQAFIWGLGTYATPAALGPDGLWTAGSLVEEQMAGAGNWPMASALATLMVAIIALVLLLARLLEWERT